MKESLSKPGSPGFWSTVFLLLGAARRRANGRLKRQRKLNPIPSISLESAAGFIFVFVFLASMNLFAARAVYLAVTCGERVQTEINGKIVVSRQFIDSVNQLERASRGKQIDDSALAQFCSSEAHDIANYYGGSEKAIGKQLHDAVRAQGIGSFVSEDIAVPGFRAFPQSGAFPAILGSIFLILWGFMITLLREEGPGFDLQRRRHPMWEWLFSHPVPARAVFLAELLSPIAANSFLWGAPVFVGLVYGFAYGTAPGILAGFIIGIPVAVGPACLGEALEIVVMLRVAPLTRGAVLWTMRSLGYVSMVLLVLSGVALPLAASALGKLFRPLATVPWPWLGLFLGQQQNGTFSFGLGLSVCWIAALLLIAGSVWITVWGAQLGLSGNTNATPIKPSRGQSSRFEKDPLYRKEFLWFARDRSTIVQAILIPLGLVGYLLIQVLFNPRLGELLLSSWSFVCGVAICFGVYFLWKFCPKSLASEGGPLWIALTWPKGLEDLLKAKARIWSLVSTGIVSFFLICAAFVYPEDTWKIALAGIAWWLFSKSMAEKAVTLVTVTSSSGEAEKVPIGRQLAVGLGSSAFCIGVMFRQWHIAVPGFVYSYLTAAAMWQNFRARLPYLYDPWSEKPPPAPTLTHALVAITSILDGGMLISALALIWIHRANAGAFQLVVFGLFTIIVALCTWIFLKSRGVYSKDVWNWPRFQNETTADSRQSSFFLSLIIGVAGGFALGLIAHGYGAILSHIPFTAELIRKSNEEMAGMPGFSTVYKILGIAVAPFTEEYLFRGLLFRALDREWGGWRAIFGSAVFFAIFHPALSWLPVFLLGVANALIFKKTERLAPAVALHMIYNITVLFV